MITKINLWLSLIFKFGVLALAFLAPLFFWSYTTEFYETPKFVLLMIATFLFILLWVSKWIITGRVSFTISKLDLPFLLLLFALVLSTLFAASKTVAIFGYLPRIHGGLASYILYIVFYFVLAANLKKVATVKEITYALLASAIILAILSLLSYAGINLLSLPWTAGANFTPTGSSFSTAAILTLLLPFPISAILYGSKISSFDNESKNEELDLPISSLMGDHATLNEVSVKTIWAILLGLFTITLVLIGTLPMYIAALAVLALMLFVTPPNLIAKNSAYLFIPIITAILIAFISFVPIGGSKNIFYSRAQSFTREPQLPFDVSWHVSVGAFRDSPFWGTGPASYLADFTLYKPIWFNNNTTLWNVKFDQAFNEYLQILATSGAIGFIVIIFLTVVALAAAFKTLSNPRVGSIRLPLAIATIAFFVILALHASTLIFWVIGILLIVCFLAVTRESDSEISFEKSSTATFGSSTSQINPFAYIIAIIMIGAMGFVLWQTTQALVADFHHRQGLKALSTGQGIIALNEFIMAEQFNPKIDLYRSNLAQINFALANSIAASKAPTEASPSGSLTDQDKQNIQMLLSQSINEGQAATALNPNNSSNWEVLGGIYRQISGVAQDALQYALDSYGKAIQRDPLNPNLRMAVGSIYLSINNLDMAIRFFTDAANLKPDLANAYYNLAIVYDKKGDTTNAVLAAQQTVSLLDSKSEDYKIATQVLNSLKDKYASESAKAQAEQQAKQTAQQQSLQSTSQESALQDKSLPKVVNLPKQERVATPSAIKISPTPTSTPTE